MLCLVASKCKRASSLQRCVLSYLFAQRLNYNFTASVILLTVQSQRSRGRLWFCSGSFINGAVDWIPAAQCLSLFIGGGAWTRRKLGFQISWTEVWRNILSLVNWEHLLKSEYGNNKHGDHDVISAIIFLDGVTVTKTTQHHWSKKE